MSSQSCAYCTRLINKLYNAHVYGPYHLCKTNCLLFSDPYGPPTNVNFQFTSVQNDSGLLTWVPSKDQPKKPPVCLCLILLKCLLYLLCLTFASLKVFSSPEHKVLRVSYCDRPLSVVTRHAACVVRRPSFVNFFT